MGECLTLVIDDDQTVANDFCKFLGASDRYVKRLVEVSTCFVLEVEKKDHLQTLVALLK
jgi:hypothetical protein